METDDTTFKEPIPKISGVYSKQTTTFRRVHFPGTDFRGHTEHLSPRARYQLTTATNSRASVAAGLPLNLCLCKELHGETSGLKPCIWMQPFPSKKILKNRQKICEPFTKEKQTKCDTTILTLHRFPRTRRISVIMGLKA